MVGALAANEQPASHCHGQESHRLVTRSSLKQNSEDWDSSSRSALYKHSGTVFSPEK